MYKCMRVCLFARLDLNVAQRQRVFSTSALWKMEMVLTLHVASCGCHAPTASINTAWEKWRHFCLLKSAA